MAGSIDPRCETIRGTHWPKEGRVVVWSSRRGNHLGQRSKAPHQQAGHMDASDPIRPSKNSCGTGAVHISVPAFGDDAWDGAFALDELLQIQISNSQDNTRPRPAARPSRA